MSTLVEFAIRPRGWLVCAAFGLLVACGASPTAPSVGLGEEFVLAAGERAYLSGTPLSVHFVGVSGDSRCPADVLCIQGGDAIVAIRVTEGRSSQVAYELHTGDMRPVSHGDVVINLVDLSPYPFSSQTIEPDEYRATLKATRAESV